MDTPTPPPNIADASDAFAQINHLYADLQRNAERSWKSFLRTPAGLRLSEEPAEAALAMRGFVFGFISATMGMTENLFRHKLVAALMPYQFIKWRLTDVFAEHDEVVTEKSNVVVALSSGEVKLVTAEKQLRHGEGGYDCLYRDSHGNYISGVTGWCTTEDILATFTVRTDLDAEAKKAAEE